ncbi:ABC transporter ATP-binding protein [Acinetobacter sp.]|uniref:ABC transporter ATP-binding protein n=1 Tax=Acinetobacter sp. TaxID=472 RepID=UPI00388EE3C4
MNIPSALQHVSKHGTSQVSTYAQQHSKVILEIADIQKAYQDKQVLTHINLDLKAGELISFLGPSGCGKTTLLRIIAGLEQPDYGKVIKKGQDITRLKAAKRQCGVVFQNYALFPNLSIAENIAFGLSDQNWSKAQKAQRVTELLDLIELPEIAARYPYQLSGGQQQRVALARALAAKPDLLLLDEPLSALDAVVRVKLRQNIRLIQRQLSIPTILVTHDQEEALSISDRIAVMYGGKIEQLDTPHNIYYAPQTRFVAAFIGNMNFLSGDVCANQALMLHAGEAVLNHPHHLPTGTAFEIGFRPENAVLSAACPVNAQGVVMKVRPMHTEFLGAKKRIFCQMLANKGQAIDLQVDIEHQNTLQLNDEMWLSVASQHVYLFDEAGRVRC